MLVLKVGIKTSGCMSDTNGVYFERRLPTDVHKKNIMPFHHMLKHLLAGKGSNGWSERIKHKNHFL